MNNIIRLLDIVSESILIRAPGHRFLPIIDSDLSVPYLLHPAIQRNARTHGVPSSPWSFRTEIISVGGDSAILNPVEFSVGINRAKKRRTFLPIGNIFVARRSSRQSETGKEQCSFRLPGRICRYR
jgi:hypothetical protein